MAGEYWLKVSHDEALVLFEWISRFNDKPTVEFADQAEERVLWSVEAMLQTKLVEPFRDDYLESLAKARANVRDSTK